MIWFVGAIAVFTVAIAVLCLEIYYSIHVIQNVSGQILATVAGQRERHAELQKTLDAIEGHLDAIARPIRAEARRLDLIPRY
jgi:Flp pilus assembly protein TadB